MQPVNFAGWFDLLCPQGIPPGGASPQLGQVGFWRPRLGQLEDWSGVAKTREQSQPSAGVKPKDLG